MKTRLMKILFIATANPFVRSGGGIANYAYFKALDSLFPNSVDMVLPEEEVPASHNIHKIYPAKRRLGFGRIVALLTGSIHRYKNTIANILKTEKYDLCFINGGLYAGDMMDMFKRAGVKTIVMHHNFEREFQSTAYANPLFNRYFVHFTIKNERSAYLKADVNLFITAEDKELFLKAYGKTTAYNQVIGVFEPTVDSIKDYKNKNKTFTAVISGSVNADQTVDGIRDFHDNYWDILKAIVPDYKLIFTGRNADRLYTVFPDFKDEQIEIIPNPDDINEIVSRAHLYICPINVGGGLKLRVMDGLKVGLPVLVHSVSARGYEPFIGKKYYRVYNDKQSFEIGLIELVRHINDGFDGTEVKTEYNRVFGLQSGINRFQDLFENLKTLQLI